MGYIRLNDSDLCFRRNFYFDCPATGEYIPERSISQLWRIRSNGEEFVVAQQILWRFHRFDFQKSHLCQV